MSWIKNLALLVVSTIVSLVLVEVALRVDGRYADVASTKLEASNTIYARIPGSVDRQSHPDIAGEVELVFDRYGNRNHTGEDLGQIRDSIGFFGDSYAENRRVEDPFTFTSVLNALAGEPMFVNFGTAGFGLEQSFQKYLNLNGSFDLKHVVYVFCFNDYRNLYEVQLFEHPYPDTASDLVNTSLQGGRDRPVMRGLGRLHLTYFAMNAWFQIKGRDYGNLAQAYSRRFVDRPAPAAGDRVHDAYADAMTEDLLGPSPQEANLDFAQRFRELLGLWADTVERNGQTFHVVVLPTEIDAAVFAAVVPDPEGLNVHHIAPNDAFPAIADRPWEFRNDGHWNEFSNLGAAASLAEYFAGIGAFEPRRPLDSVWDLVPRIEALYERASG